MILSHPSWVCGLKQTYYRDKVQPAEVTPFVGVWIETSTRTRPAQYQLVTPFVGVWIETIFQYQVQKANMGHTLRGCVD